MPLGKFLLQTNYSKYHLLPLVGGQEASVQRVINPIKRRGRLMTTPSQPLYILNSL